LSENNAFFGICFANFAICRHFVEMFSELEVPVIFPSDSSV